MRIFITEIFILFFMTTAGYCQDQKQLLKTTIKPDKQVEDSLEFVKNKDQICEEQFDFVLAKLEKLAKQYQVFANFKKQVSIQKEFVESEKGMYYGLDFTNNYEFSKLSPKSLQADQPYLGVNFSLRTGHYSGQANVALINEYFKRAAAFSPIQHRFNSGIIVFGNVVTNDDKLKVAIYKIFDEAIQNIFRWERGQD